MPNLAQLEFLDSLISEQGDYYLTVKNHAGLNLGEKLLYLERAITPQEPENFLVQLDKLYQPGLTGEAKQSNLDFICSLKRINELCFDHTLTSLGGKSALEYYFGSLGVIETTDKQELQASIQNKIHENIAGLYKDKEEEIKAQQEKRINAELRIVPNRDWRDAPLFTEETLERSIALQQYWQVQLQRTHIPCNMMILGLFMTAMGALSVAVGVLWTRDPSLKTGTVVLGAATLLSGLSIFAIGSTFRMSQCAIEEDVSRALNA